jgi:hypothetical protein
MHEANNTKNVQVENHVFAILIYAHVLVLKYLLKNLLKSSLFLQYDKDDCWNIKCDLAWMSKPNYSHHVSSPRSQNTTMLTFCMFLIAASISFDITKLLLLPLRACFLFSQCSLAYFTVFYMYCLENSSPLSRLATASSTNTEVR